MYIIRIKTFHPENVFKMCLTNNNRNHDFTQKKWHEKVADIKKMLTLLYKLFHLNKMKKLRFPDVFLSHDFFLPLN